MPDGGLVDEHVLPNPSAISLEKFRPDAIFICSVSM